MAVGVALKSNDLGVMNQPVDEGDHAGGVGKHFGPLGKRSIGGDQRALVLVAATYQLKEQIGSKRLGNYIPPPTLDGIFLRSGVGFGRCQASCHLSDWI